MGDENSSRKSRHSCRIRWGASGPQMTGITSAPFSDLNPYMSVPARWAMTELSESRCPGSAVAARALTAVPW